MAVKMKRLTLWRREDRNRPGLLAETLGPLAQAGADLKVVMGYRVPGQESQAVIELAPVSARRQEEAARAGRLAPATAIPTLLVEGDDRPALGHGLSRALADAGIDIAFLVAQVVGDRYSAVFGFPGEDEARRAEAIIKKTSAALGRAARTKRKSAKPKRKAARTRGARGKTGKRRR